jgi:hypothetical protein
MIGNMSLKAELAKPEISEVQIDFLAKMPLL